MADLKAPASAIPPPDRYQIERLNRLYRIIDEAPSGGGLKARLASGARRLLGRVLSRQQEFNATVVDHHQPQHHGRRGALRRGIERIDAAVERCDGVTDEIERHLEALLARERRNDTAVAALAAQQDELRAAISVMQQAAHGLKRELAALASASANPNSQIPSPKSQSNPESRIPNPGSPGPSSQFDDLDSHKYVGFEDQFRGSPEDIRRRVEEYLPVFADASDVLDVGCGRGEFLELLRERGIRARGIDINAAMVDVCREKGLDAETGDALTLSARACPTDHSADCSPRRSSSTWSRDT